MHETKNGTAGKQHRVASGRVEKTQRTQAARWGIGTGNGMGNGGGPGGRAPKRSSRKQATQIQGGGIGATRARHTKRSPDG